jgi:hypothetical protein
MTATSLTLKKAERRQLDLRLGLIGPSGAGKTYSALMLAKGIESVTKRPTLLLDTEHERGLIYANEFDYYYEPFELPLSPERYIEYMTSAVKAGVGQLIIDSTSHEWKHLLAALSASKGTGGNKNDFAAWDKITPRHDAFVEAIIRAPIHLLILMRGKDEYVLENQNGKNVPKKVGVGAIMRDGLEYECNVAWTLDVEGNIARQTKDDSHRFEDCARRLTVDDGKFLAEWALNGIEWNRPAPALDPSTPQTTAKLAAKDRFETIKAEIEKSQTLPELANTWQTHQKEMKAMSDEHQELLLTAKNEMKATLAAPAAPAADSKSNTPEPEKTPDPEPEGKQLFGDDGAVRPPVSDLHGVQETNALVSLVHSCKVKGMLDGVAESAKEYFDTKKITDTQYGVVLDEITNRRNLIMNAKKAKVA